MSNIIYTCQIPSEVSDYIQTLELEKTARENLIITIITAGIDPLSDNAKFYFDEYVEFAIKYNLVQSELANSYIPSEFLNNTWMLNYSTHILTVEEKSDSCKCKY